MNVVLVILILTRRSWGVGASALAATVALIGGGELSAGAARTASQRGIAYVTGPGPGIEQVWLADAELRHRRRLGQGEQPLLSPNGRMVAATAIQGPQALIVYSATSKPKGFFDLSRVAARPLAWSPDSRYLAVATGGYVATASTGASQLNALLVIDTQTGRAMRIASGYVAGASFAPSGVGRLVFGLGRTSPIMGSLDLYTAAADGRGGLIRLTRDRRSLNPVWGARGIAFDRESRSGYQIFLRAGRRTQQITQVRLSSQEQGLIPIAFSRDGRRLVARLEGFHQNQAWTVDLARNRVRRLMAAGNAAPSLGISGDGRRVLVGTVHEIETIPFTGGRRTLLISNADQPSWNQYFADEPPV